MISHTALLALVLLATSSLIQEPASPPELGKLRYSRDIDGTLLAQKEAKRDGKPIFVVFQEIPG